MAPARGRDEDGPGVEPLVKIAYLNPGGAIGGAEMCLLDVLTALRASRPDARPFVVLGEDGPLRDKVQTLGIPCDVMPIPEGVSRLGDSGATGVPRLAALAARGLFTVPSTIAYARRLGRRLRDEQPDLVQTNGMKMHLLGAWTAPRGVPVVWHMHDYLGSRPAMARLLRASLRRGVEAVAVTRSVADDVRATLGGRVPVRSIHNAVDLDRFHPGPGDGHALDRASDLPPAAPGTVRVGLVATFASWKGHDLFLEAAARVPADRPARFYIIGGPIYQTVGSETTMGGLIARSGRLGLADRVGFAGQWAEPADAIRGLDIVVHASTRPEPFGRVIVEAMACGRAVIAMKEGGAAELFHDGEDAIGCPPRDPQALASDLLRLIDDSSLRDRLGAAGHRSAVARFDRTRLAEDWSPIYDRRVRPVSPASDRPARPTVAPRISP